MTRSFRWTDRCSSGILAMLAGVVLLAGMAVGRPEVVARFFSSDGQLSATGLEQIELIRRTLGVWGILSFVSGLGLTVAPATFRRRIAAWLERWGGGLVAAGAVLFLALFTFNSVCRTARFSPDSMNYVDVARHISRGQGIVQSTLGFNQKIVDPAVPIPVPLFVQPPLYPILIAAASATGLPHADAALLLSALGYALVVLLMYRLARRLYGQATAMIALAMVLAYQPLHWTAGYAWSDTICLAFALGAVAVLVVASGRPEGGRLPALGSGALAALAVASRFSMIPLVVMGPAFLLVAQAPWGLRIRRTTLFVLGVVLILGPLAWRSLRLVGSAMPGAIAPVRPGIIGEILAALIGLFGRYAGLHPIIELPVMLMGMLLVAVLLARRGELRTALHDVSASWPLRLPLVWPLLNVAFVLLAQQFMYIESFGARYILPAGLFLILPAAFLVERAWRPDRVRVVAAALGIIVLKSAAELVLLHSGATFRPADPVASSARLSWVAHQTSERDLILGDDTMDIPFWLGRSAAVSFSPAPAPSPTHELLRAVCRAHAAEYDRFYIVLRNNYTTQDQWRGAYGPFIADLVVNGPDRYPGISRVARLDDGHVFELNPGTR